MKKGISHNYIHGRTVRRRTALTLLLCMLLSVCSACGKQETAAAPELLEPVTLTESYRPVEKKDIGEVKFLEGIVVPESYPVFSKTTFDIYEMKVNPGDHVEKGQVIATGDTRAIDSQIRNLSKQIDTLNVQRSAGDSISRKTEARLEYLKKASEEVGLPAEAEVYATEIRKEQENRRYDLASADSAISELNKQISKLKESRSKLTFTAPHSGTVTYLFDLSAGNMVFANSNIAVISDFDDLYIETEQTTDEYKYKDYEQKYIMADGKKLPVEEYDYTSAEQSYASSVGNYPPVRFRAQGAKLEAGSTVPIYFTKVGCTDVLAVGNDSIYQEGETYYCYVLDQDGQRERRNLTLGVRDALYSEVKAGLSEGERVFYDNKAVIPAKYQEHTVEIGDYVEEHESTYFDMYLTEHDIYLASADGSVTDVKASAGSEVAAGAEIMTISIPSARGEKAEQQNRLADTEQRHKTSVAGYDAKEKELKEELEEAKKEPEPKVPSEPAKTLEAVPAIGQNDGQTASDDETDEVPGTDGEAAGSLETDKEAAPDDEEDKEEETTGSSQEELEEIRDKMYLKERLQLDLEILSEERKLEAAEYSANIESIREEMNQSSAGSGGTSVVKADKAGEIGENIPRKDSMVSKGQCLFVVSRIGENLLRVNMPSKRGQPAASGAKPGQKITFETESGSFTGTCVGENGNPGHVYLFTRDGEVHMTTSAAYVSGNDEQFIVKMDDDRFFAGAELPSAKVKFRGVAVSGGITIPAKCVYTEQDTMNQTTTTFVWKVTKDGLTKTPVTIYEIGQYSDERLILSGLSVGDVIALE